MGVIKENKVLLDRYLKTRDDKLIGDILNNSNNLVEKAIKAALRRKGIDENHYVEYLGECNLFLYNKIATLEKYDGTEQNFYAYIFSWTIYSVNQEVKKENKRLSKIYSLDDLKDDFDCLYRANLLDDSIECVEEKVYIEQIKKMMFGSNSVISDKQRHYIELYYGFNGYRVHSLEEIARLNNISSAAVSDAMRRAFKVVKNVLIGVDSKNQINKRR